MAYVNGTAIQHTLVVITFRENCSGQSPEDSTMMVLLRAFQFLCHLSSFVLALIAFFVVKFYAIAGKRMNHMLLLLTLMEIVFNVTSVCYYLSRVFPTSNVKVDVYVRVVLALLSKHTTILNRNWWTALIAIARFLVVYKPLGRCHLTVTYTNVFFGVICFVGALYTLVFTLWFRIFVKVCASPKVIGIHIWDLHGSSIFYRVADALTVCIKTMLPLVVVIIFSILTYNIVRRPSVPKRDHGITDRRTSKTLLFICLLFAICQIPYAMTIIFCFLDRSPIVHLYKVLKRLSLILVAVNSFGNVAIYFARSKDFRTALRDMRRCRFDFVALRRAAQRQKYMSSLISRVDHRSREEERTLTSEEAL